jgi:hypothetical protein
LEEPELSVVYNRKICVYTLKRRSVLNPASGRGLQPVAKIRMSPNVADLTSSIVCKELLENHKASMSDHVYCKKITKDFYREILGYITEGVTKCFWISEFFAKYQ